jgi:hypothetical protein
MNQGTLRIAQAAEPFTQVGAAPVVARNGEAGVVVRPTYVDRAQPNLLTALICPSLASWAECRPATSEDGGASFTLHDAPQFAEIESAAYTWLAPTVARSAADPHRIYFAAAGHPWNSADPKGGLWRSDDDGRTWTQNLRAGEPGESGLIGIVIPDPINRERVFIGRGYDYGNVSASDDAGASFNILCGHNNVSKSSRDIECGANATLGIDFAAGVLVQKHHFVASGWRVGSDGAGGKPHMIPGLGWGETANLGALETQLDLAVRGAPLGLVGGRSFRASADGAAVLYLATDARTLFRADSALRTGQAVTGVSPGGNKILLTHPTEACTWLVQTAAAELARTEDCGASWSSLALPSGAAAVVSGAYAPDGSGLVVFTEDGRRYRTE